MSAQENSLDTIRRLAGGESSLKLRLVYVALLLVSAVMTTVVGSLWLTEPSLPMRTSFALGVMTLMGASWMAFAISALSTRLALFARDRLIAGRIAVTFTSIFLAGAIVAVVVANSPAAYAVLCTGAVMLAVAIHILVAARRRVSELTARRNLLER